MIDGRRTFNKAKRRAIYDDMQRVIARTLPVLPAFDEKFNVAYAPRVHFDRTVMLPDYQLFWNIWDWSLTK